MIFSLLSIQVATVRWIQIDLLSTEFRIRFWYFSMEARKIFLTEYYLNEFSLNAKLKTLSLSFDGNKSFQKDISNELDVVECRW